MKLITVILFASIFTSCSTKEKKDQSYSDVQVVGAMKNVMWKGELSGSISLDTIPNRKGLYGIGPVSYLAGEILINDGRSYVSTVNSDSSITVSKSYDISAPFFVFSNVSEWRKVELPANIKSINDLEAFIDQKTKDQKRPFAFKLIGSISKAIIHIQNLPEGAKVSSPEDAHQGQVNYHLSEEEVEIVGFFSTKHQGVFTHHDSFLHMHLVTKDENQMGHLDSIEFENMTLLLPIK